MNARRIKDGFGIVLSTLVVIFILGLIFVPLHKFVYVNFLFKLFLYAIPFYIVAELYFFAKDSTQRRAGTLRKKKKSIIFPVAEWVVIVLVLILFFLAKNGSIFPQECPSVIQGNPDAELTIKYFFNPFCTSCWSQEAIVREAITTYGTDVRLERYDYRYCDEKSRELDVRAIPGFLFQTEDDRERFGFLSQERMSEIVCQKIECEN